MKSLLLVAFLLFTASAVYGSGQIYGVYTSSTDTETIVWTSSVNLDTGALTNVSEVEVFAGASAMSDGISAYDLNNNIYYFTDDNVPPMMYGADTTTNSNLPVTNFYVDAILKMAVDQKTSEVVLAVVVKKKTKIIAQSYPPGNFRSLSENFPYQEVLGVTYDGVKDMLVFLVVESTGKFALVNMNPVTGQTSKPIMIGNEEQIFLENIYFDKNSGMIFGGGFNHSFVYCVLTINPLNGDSNTTLINTDGGNVVAWSLDNTNSWMWYSVASDSGVGFLMAWDMAKNNQTAMIQTQFVLESIEVAL